MTDPQTGHRTGGLTPMTRIDPALAEHATRLLVGTGLTPADAADLAAARTPATGPLADALRDGWTTDDQPGGDQHTPSASESAAPDSGDHR
jgi:hypothetical protein